MQPVRPLFYLSVVNTIAFIIGSQTVHVWLNPMKDYKDFILKAEAEYEAHQQELCEVEEYLVQQHLKQIILWKYNSFLKTCLSDNEYVYSAFTTITL